MAVKLIEPKYIYSLTFSYSYARGYLEASKMGEKQEINGTVFHIRCSIFASNIMREGRASLLYSVTQQAIVGSEHIRSPYVISGTISCCI